MSSPEFSNAHELLPGQELSISVPPVYKPSDNLNLPFTPEEIEALSKPKVLISGGGIGGLTLALLLHKANIPFLVLERAKEIKPLGKKFSRMTFLSIDEPDIPLKTFPCPRFVNRPWSTCCSTIYSVGNLRRVCQAW